MGICPLGKALRGVLGWDSPAPTKERRPEEQSPWPCGQGALEAGAALPDGRRAIPARQAGGRLAHASKTLSNYVGTFEDTTLGLLFPCGKAPDRS